MNVFNASVISGRSQPILLASTGCLGSVAVACRRPLLADSVEKGGSIPTHLPEAGKMLD